MRQRGQSLVEFALLFPILIMLLLGLVDFGRVYYVAVAINDAADEGATYAAIRPNDDAGIAARATGATGGLVTITADQVMIYQPPTVAPGQPITVVVQYHFDFYTPFVSSFFEGGTLDLQGSASHPILSVR